VLKLLLVVILVAVVIYLATRAIQRRGIAPAPARRSTQQRRIIAPDDDPEFLRDLERKRRHPEDPDS
jgi:hypothetical protein